MFACCLSFFYAVFLPSRKVLGSFEVSHFLDFFFLLLYRFFVIAPGTFALLTGSAFSFLLSLRRGAYAADWQHTLFSLSFRRGSCTTHWQSHFFYFCHSGTGAFCSLTCRMMRACYGIPAERRALDWLSSRTSSRHPAPQGFLWGAHHLVSASAGGAPAE